MGLCKVCLNISFTSLPKAPAAGHYSYSLNGDRFARVVEPDLRGTPYYENIAALAASGEACQICSVVRDGVQRWRKKWEKLPNKRSEVPSLGMEIMPEHEPLVLTQCANAGQGFIVWSNDPVKKIVYEILAVVGFAVKKESPLAHLYPMRPFDEESRSEYSLDLAAAWVQTCSHEHEKCRNEPGPMPTRVLDVGAAGDVIRLKNGSSITGEYSCLSYCWGNATPFTTTRATIGRRECGFELKEAPQTLQDAVTITRHLGLRYLWVDALCICQNDAEDWARESSRMTETYANAHVVIAASWGKDSTSGIFHKRTRTTAMVDLPCGHNGLQANLLDDRKQYGGYITTELDKQPLMYRGWTLQERVLARRILHYTSTQMYFECEHGITNEEGPTGQDRFCSLTALLGLPKGELDEDIKRSWIGLISDYTKRELTHPTDRLPAISGLAKLFDQMKRGPEYVAGLWSDDFISELTWTSCNVKNGRPFSAYAGPSWSWIGLNDAAFFSYAPAWEHIAEVLGWTRKFKDENNRYGELESASIQIRGPVIKAMPSMYSVATKSPPWFWVYTAFSTTAAKCRMDHDMCDEQWRSSDLQILVLRGRINMSPIPIEWFGLVITRCSDHESGAEAWKRIGCVKLHKDELPVPRAQELLKAKDKWETLTLV